MRRGQTRQRGGTASVINYYYSTLVQVQNIASKPGAPVRRPRRQQLPHSRQCGAAAARVTTASMLPAHVRGRQTNKLRTAASQLLSRLPPGRAEYLLQANFSLAWPALYPALRCLSASWPPRANRQLFLTMGLAGGHIHIVVERLGGDGDARDEVQVGHLWGRQRAGGHGRGDPRVVNDSGQPRQGKAQGAAIPAAALLDQSQTCKHKEQLWRSR